MTTDRRAGARAQDALDAAIDRAVATITGQDARGFFRHCGYPPRSMIVQHTLRPRTERTLPC